jgi:hypothetical protein
MRSLFLLILLIVTKITLSQSLTGSWYGKADVVMEGLHNNYLTELVIKQKGNEIEGIFAYYFKNIHQSFYVHGTYNEKTKEVRIPDLPLIYFNTNSTVNSIECNTEFRGTLFVSKVKKAINGHLLRDEKYIYTCPDLRIYFTMDSATSQADVVKNSAIGKIYWTPAPDDYIVNTDNTQKEVIAPMIEQPKISHPNEGLKINSIDITPSQMDLDAKEITNLFLGRKTIYSKDLDIQSDSIKVSFYDNGDIDGDSISVFLNKKLVLTHQELSARAINIFVQLDSTKEVNEISMFAENLGSIPPNTALMIVSDGVDRYEVFMSSSLTQNSTVRLRRKKK